MVSQDELGTADLLPADRPIVAALRLPERLMEVSTPYYRVGEFSLTARRGAGADAAHEGHLETFVGYGLNPL